MRFCLSVIRAAGYQHYFLFEPCCCRILSLVYEETRAMPGKRAKVLSVADVGDLLVFASCTRHPLRKRRHRAALGQGGVAGWGGREPDVGHGG